MAKSNFKKSKFEGQILEKLNVILRRGVGDARLQNASITKVELSPDFSYAKVYWDTFDAEKKDEIGDAFQKFTGRARTQLAEALKVRNTPQITFFYDSQYEAEQEIVSLLKGESDEGKFKS
ncbi:MAG: 30S ribosome-binding factor RbfA [Bdellovibrionales bacterium]|nr:30S ribosome-binding factor RbfA [Bdellovibrionales bacterium]